MRGLSDLTLASRLRSFSHISSLFAIAVGLLTLVGWLADIQVLKSIAPLLPSMKANSALCLVLVGLALWLVQERGSLGATDRPRKGFVSRNASIVCAGSVALVACLTALEYALGWDFRIDQLLFNDAGAPFEMTPAGRMAPATALDYLFLSVALTLLTRKADRAHRASQFLSLAVGVLSLLALVGYVDGAYQTYDLTYHRSMALHEAGALVVFSAAVLFARPQSGYVLTMTGQGHVGILVRRLLPWAVGVPFLLGWLRLEAERNGIQLTDIEFSLFVVSNMVIFSVLIWASARSLVATEQTLRESEERYHSIFDNSEDAILLTVPDGRILAANLAGCQMFGRSEEEICQIGRSGLVDSSDPRLLLALEERERTGRFKGELTFVRRNGERFPAEVTSTVFHDSQRNPRTSMIIRDITERKRADEALRESERKNRALIEAIPDAIFRVSRDGIFLDVPVGKDSTLALPRSAFVGKRVDELFPEDLSNMALEAAERALWSGTLQVLEYEMPVPSGTKNLRDYEARIVPCGPDEVLAISRDITERKRADEALRKSEEKYRGLVENLRDVIFEIDSQGIIKYISPIIFRTLGYAVEEIIGKHFIGFVSEEDRKLVSERFSELQEGVVRDLEYRLISKSGDVRWVRTFTNPKFEENEFKGGEGTLIDITERKLAEETLRESEERFRRLCEGSFEGIVIHDEGKIVDANEVFAAMFAYDLSELIGKNALDFATPELREIAERHIRTGSEEPYEGLALRKDGSTFDVEVRGKNIPYEGRMVRVTALLDITERKRAEERLQESEEQFRSLVEAAPDVIYTISAEDGSLTSLNPAFETITGWSRAEWLGKPFMGIVHPDDRSAAVETFQKALRGESPPLYQVRILSKSGEYLVGEFTSTPQVKGGKVAGELGIARDITGRKCMAEERVRSEKLLRESRDRLELALAGADLGMWDWSIPTNRNIYNTRWAEMLGYSLDELEPSHSTWEELVHPEDRARVVGALKAHVEGKTPTYETEHRLRTKSGEWKWILDRGKVLEWDDQGKPVRAAGTHMDITERKKAEFALQAAKSRLQRLSRRLLEVQENDRRMLARELHDEIGQILTAAKIDLEVVLRGKIPGDLATRLNESIASLSNCLSRVRNLSLDLRPPMLDDLGLVAALRWQLDRQAQRVGYQAELLADDSIERFHSDIETACFRIAQEALTNVARHAQAKHVEVELQVRDREVVLDIRDDGIGFDVEHAAAEAVHGTTFGILGMQERVSLLSRNLEISSTKMQGTVVSARFPLQYANPSGQ